MVLREGVRDDSKHDRIWCHCHMVAWYNMGRQPGEAASGCIRLPLSLGGADVTLSEQDVAVVKKL